MPRLHFYLGGGGQRDPSQPRVHRTAHHKECILNLSLCTAQGPAPLNLEVPPYAFIEGDAKIKIG
jgi:hypothetical protein